MSETYSLRVGVDVTVRECPTCHVLYGVTQDFIDRKDREGGSWYCPNGHAIVFTKSSLARAEEQLEKERKRVGFWREHANGQEARAEHAERSANAFKGHLTRAKNRISKGVCPCCNRHFVDLQRHMETKHPDYTED